MAHLAHRGAPTHIVPVLSSANTAWASAPEPLVPVRAPAPKPASFWADLGNGLVLGDFAREKRLGGATVQVICSFTPGVGTLCALRDATADARYRDGLGVCLNLLALVPIFGGFPKTLHVILELWHARHVMRMRKRHALAKQQVSYVPVSAVPTQRLLPPGRQPGQLPPPAPRR